VKTARGALAGATEAWRNLGEILDKRSVGYGIYG
jgi:hypothetical protein